jgi:hypothetical protein
LTVFEEVEVPSVFVAVHVLVVPDVGPGIEIAGSHPLVLVGAGFALTFQCRTTMFPCVLPRYQPFVPAMPSIVELIVGDAAEAVVASSRTAMSPQAANAVTRRMP